MEKSFSFFIEMIVKKTFIIILLLFVCQNISFAQVVYVDCNTGNDNNNGTKESPLYSIGKAAEIIQSKDNDIFIMKINPGIYVLDKHISVFTEKEMTGKRIIIEANILPGDTLWTPEKMPVILSSAPKGEFENKRWVVAFLVNESHVTIRGLKFQGYAYPNTQYFPIDRINRQKTDLLVEQCMFVGDQQSAAIQVGVIGNGNEIKINHCIFYKTNNAVVYFKDSGNGIKKGNSLTNSIIYGASEAALWTSWPDSDFIFKNNIIANNERFWVRYYVDNSIYTLNNSVIVNNKKYQIEVTKDYKQIEPDYKFIENNIVKEGHVSLRILDNVFKPIPIDYLHVLPDSLGYDIGAGLFKK